MSQFSKKILCIGAEIPDTDLRVTELAQQHGTLNHGLITDRNYVPQQAGFYHTTVVDINEGEILFISPGFDEIWLLDQHRSHYPHWKSLLKTFRVFKTLEDRGIAVNYKNNNNVRKLDYWWNYLRTNPSFCFHPFLAMIPDTNVTNICPKTQIPIKPPADIVHWQSDPDYRRLRDPMLEGKRLPLYCHDCYDKENRGVESTRQFETLEWAARMDFDSPEEFNTVENPVFYEIRPSSKCNIMCRMCDDAHSHLIEQEYKQIGIPLLPFRFQDLPFELIKLETLERIYVGGGEPTIMPEFYQFLQRCIDVDRTDFELCIGTNGMKFSDKLMKLLSRFSNVVFSISFDGFGRVNNYIRWLSDFDTMCKNAHLVMREGHLLALQTVPSIYNVTRLHELWEFFDHEFPDKSCLVQGAEGRGGIFRPWNHPRADLVVDSLERCMKTNQYALNGRSMKGYVDGLYALYSSPDFAYDAALLKKFFEFNDKMDRARDSRLGDYIPELEDCRKLVQ